VAKKITEQDIIFINKLREYAKNISVLFVEHDDKLRLATLDILKLASFKNIVVAKSGEEAFNAYADNKFDIILTDIINTMSTNGMDFVRMIKDISCDAHIIVFTAHNESRYYNELINLGIDGFIIKPLNMMLFLFTLSRSCKAISDSKQNEILKREVLAEQNRTIAISYAIENNREITPHEMALLRKTYAVTSALEFIEKHPIDLNYINDRLEAMDDQFELHIDRFLNEKDFISQEFTASAFEIYGDVLDSTLEFANLAEAFKNFAQVIQEIENLNNVDACKDMMFGIAHTIHTWRMSIFVNQDAENIHYLDASIINDLITIEAVLKNQDVETQEIEFF
jgi:DNA-binding NarL/FixJ family response regulator